MQDTIAVSDGWNMIGTISDSVQVGTIQQIPPTIISSQFYGYNEGYSPDTVLLPSRGYWVKTVAPGFLDFVHRFRVLERWCLLLRRLLTKLLQLRYRILARLQPRPFCFTSEPLEKKELDYFELPPRPPEGVFDARFSTNRMLEVVKEGESKTIPIQVSYAQYPLTISWEMKDRPVTASLMIGAREIKMTGNGSTVITDLKASIALRVVGKTDLPREFALRQNYPNPFNPSTTIKYDLSVDSRVTLKVFNILGQEVVTLVSEDQKAGYRSVEWNASNMASGVYFYRLQAESFSEIRQLILLR